MCDGMARSGRDMHAPRGAVLWRPSAGVSPCSGVRRILEGLVTPHHHVLLLLPSNDVGVEAIPRTDTHGLGLWRR